jgi:Tol biopolymer transport system component
VGPGGVWGTPQLVPGVSTTGTDKWFMPCSRNNTYLTILGNDIGEGTIGSPPAVLAQLNAPTGTETGTFLTQDCLTVYFASTRSGSNQIYVATRGSLGATWSAPALVTDFQVLGGNQEDPWVSPDQRTFALVSDVSGSKDVYLSTR